MYLTYNNKKNQKNSWNLASILLYFKISLILEHLIHLSFFLIIGLGCFKKKTNRHVFQITVKILLARVRNNFLKNALNLERVKKERQSD